MSTIERPNQVTSICVVPSQWAAEREASVSQLSLS